MVKLIKTIASRHSDAVPDLMEAREWQIPDVFPEKSGRFFPIRNPLYFRAINAFFSPLNALYDQLHSLFFVMKGTRLNCTVFFSLK
jgi:hypothetical protein